MLLVTLVAVNRLCSAVGLKGDGSLEGYILRNSFQIHGRHLLCNGMMFVLIDSAFGGIKQSSLPL